MLPYKCLKIFTQVLTIQLPFKRMDIAIKGLKRQGIPNGAGHSPEGKPTYLNGSCSYRDGRSALHLVDAPPP